MEKQCQYCTKSIPVEVEACIYCGKIQKAGNKAGNDFVKCKKCAMDIPAAATICPYCKKRQKMSLFVKILLVWVGVVIIVPFFIGNVRGPDGNVHLFGKKTATNTLNTQDASNPVKYEETISARLTANELDSQYHANEIKADILYKNKLIEVSGVVSDIGKDFTDSAYVHLNASWAHSIHCFLADSEQSNAARLSKGESIIVEGKSGGLLLGNVILRNCKIK